MKNKKSFLTLGLLTLILVLGVGYAVVSSVGLTIGGTASVAESTLNVSFNGETDTDGVGTITATAGKDTLSGTISVTGLTAIGDKATATYTIQNKEVDLDAEISKLSIINDKEEFFKVTTSVDTTATTVEAEGTNTVNVYVELIKLPIEDTDSTANITVNLTATPAQPESE